MSDDADDNYVHDDDSEDGKGEKGKKRAAPSDDTDLHAAIVAAKEKVSDWSIVELVERVKTPKLRRKKPVLAAAFVLEQWVLSARLPQLKKLCSQQGLKTSGTKPQLIERIAEHYELQEGLVKKEASERELQLQNMTKEELEKEISQYDITYKKGNMADMRRRIIHAERYHMKKKEAPLEVRHHTCVPFVPGTEASILHLPHDLIEKRIMPHVEQDFDVAMALSMTCRHLRPHGVSLMKSIAEKFFGAGADGQTVLFFRKCPAKMNKSDAKANFRLRDQDLNSLPCQSSEVYVGERYYNGRPRSLYTTAYMYSTSRLIRACIQRFGSWKEFLEYDRKKETARKRRRK